MKQKKKKMNKKLPLSKKKSPPDVQSDHGRKQFLIAIISIVAIVVLTILLLFSQQLVGKAFFTGQANSAGAELLAPAYPMQQFSLKIRTNTAVEVRTVGVSMTLPSTITCADVESVTNSLKDQGWLDAYPTLPANKCKDGIILMGYGGQPGKMGNIDVAQINFKGKAAGQYSFDITAFKALDASNNNVIPEQNILDPIVIVETAPSCGNGVKEGNEQCDNGANNGDTKACTLICINNICGDGKQYLGSEQCDDGNTASGDGCSSSCEAESGALCGDNICNVQSESTSSCPQDCGQVCPTNGLVSWWKGENNPQDSYKSGYHGTLAGNAAYTSGRVGQAFKFDGVDDLLDLGNKAGTLFADPTNSSLTVSFWMKTAATKSPQGSMYMIDSGAGTEGRRGFYCNTNQGTLYCAVRQVATIYRVSASSVIPLNSWKYVTLTFNDASNELKLYVDGALTKTGTEEQITGATFASPQAVIGATSTKSLLFNGSLDEMAVWSRALSGAEVKSLYDAGTTGMCSITYFVCGNNVQEAGEDCDDGNLVDGDGCSSTCQTESAICGDNVCEIKFESTISCPQDCGLVCPTNSLVSWWKGENGDDSFSGHDGALGGNANIISGKVDNAFYFDGEGDYLNLGQKPGTIFSDPTGSSLSVSFWMRTNATKSPGGALYILDSGAGTAARRGFYCSTNQGKLDCAIKHSNTIYQVSANNAIPLNIWKLVTFTFDQSKEELKLYVDGAYAAAGTKATLSSSSSPVPTSVIGATNLQTLSFNGTLDEIAVWDRVLTSAEVKAIFDTNTIGMCAVPESICGNSFIEAGEECDDGNVISTDACNLCKNARCGDGIIRTGVEQCDSSNLASASCQTLNFANGTLSCASSCLFNSTACMAVPSPPPPPPNVTFTANGTKISLGEIAPANNAFSTLVTATEGFTQKIMVYTILYAADGKVLKLEADEVVDGMAEDATVLVTASYSQTDAKKKSVLVFDVEPNPTVYGKLERTYN